MAKDRIQVGTDLFINKKQEKLLINYLKKRLKVAKTHRDQRVEKYECIDKQLAGYLRLSSEDRKRARECSTGESLKPYDTVLPMTIVQLDEALTYLMLVLAPDDGIYKTIAAKDKVELAKGFTSLMNEHAETYGHYNQLAKMIFDQLKYNEGGAMVEWVTDSLPVVGTELGTGEVSLSPDALDFESGNRITALDMYNTLYDPSVNLDDLTRKGEFVAIVDKMTPYAMDRLAGDGTVFGVERFLAYSATTGYEIKGKGHMYVTKPTITIPLETGGSDDTDWIAELSSQQGAKTGGIEDIKVSIWIKPFEFGLSTDKNGPYELWQIRVAQHEFVISATRLTNVHKQLPVAIGRIWNDGFNEQTRSYAELLLPYQRYASFALNVHVRSMRKKLYGLLIYDALVLPELEDADVTGGKVATKGGTAVEDLRKHVLQLNDTPDTQQNIADISVMTDIMQTVLPTDQQRQVAGLERATQYQAAAVVQGANRRNVKIARIINELTLTHLRFQQYWNILQYQPSINVLSPEGEIIEAAPRDFREAKLKFALSDMLSGVDKLSAQMNLKDVMGYIVQSQQANERVDILGLLNHYTTLGGDITDLNQYEFKHAIDALPPEEKDMAMQLLQQAQAEAEGGAQ